MEDKIIEAINHVKERIFNHILKTNTSIDQGQLMESFGSIKANGVIFNKPNGKQESYFASNKSSNSWIISDKSPAKAKTVTFTKMTSRSTPDELSIIGNPMLAN